MEQLQEQMKTANKIIRNKKTTEQEKVAQLQELGISETNAKELLNPDRFEGLGFASFSLQNNGACIRTAKLRLEKVIALKNAETKEYEINGVKVVENTEETVCSCFQRKTVRGNQIKTETQCLSMVALKRLLAIVPEPLADKPSQNSVKRIVIKAGETRFFLFINLKSIKMEVQEIAVLIALYSDESIRRAKILLEKRAEVARIKPIVQGVSNPHTGGKQVD